MVLKVIKIVIYKEEASIFARIEGAPQKWFETITSSAYCGKGQAIIKTVALSLIERLAQKFDAVLIGNEVEFCNVEAAEAFAKTLKNCKRAVEDITADIAGVSDKDSCYTAEKVNDEVIKGKLYRESANEAVLIAGSAIYDVIYDDNDDVEEIKFREKADIDNYINVMYSQIDVH